MMSYREVLLLVLLSQLVLVYTMTVVKRSPGRIDGLYAFRGAVNAAMNPVVNGKIEGRESVKRALRVPTERMARIEFCFRKKNRYHPICRRPSTPAYSVNVIVS